jgi:hypothetical protein
VRHLARHLGVAAFVGVEQAVAVQVPAERDGGEEQQQAGERGGLGGRRWQRWRDVNKLRVWVIELGR